MNFVSTWPSLKADLPRGRRLTLLTPRVTFQLCDVCWILAASPSLAKLIHLLGLPLSHVVNHVQRCVHGEKSCAFPNHDLSCQKTMRGGAFSGRIFLLKPGKATHTLALPFDLFLEGRKSSPAVSSMTLMCSA